MDMDAPADAEKTRSWKEVLDEKLLRLHSLQFGADLALDNGDPETALSLSLCLLGFLESECRSPADTTYITPIIDSTKQRLNAAREKFAPTLDRCVLEQANSKEQCIFRSTNAADLAKIKRSKFFLPYFVSDVKPVADKKTVSAENIAESVPGRETITGDINVQEKCLNALKTSTDKLLKSQHSDENSTKACKNLTQSKLTILYGNGNTKPSVAVSKPNVIASQKQSTQDNLSRTRTPQQQGSGNCASSPTYLDDDDEKSYAAAAKRRKPTLPDEAGGYGLKKVDTSNEADGNGQDAKPGGFVTAKQKWTMDSLQKKGSGSVQGQQSSSSAYTGPTSSSYHVSNNGYKSAVPKTLGMSRRGVRGNFIPPVRSNCAGGGAGGAGYATTPPSSSGQNNGLEESTRKCLESLLGPDGELPDKLRNVEPRLIEHISNEIMDQDPNVRWDDIAGLEHAKKCVTEMVIWPLLRPDIFQGCRSPGKGLLLFGPPGTGKTMIGKAIAGEAKATFFSISASSLTSKWIGEGEKLVRALFGVASCRQPAVIFIDEIDSLLSQRKSDGEHESSRRLKTQFLIEMEGCGSGNDQLLLIGATNRPQELDEAARRRLSKRLYIPLPSAEARAWIVRNLLKKDGLFTLSDDDIREICNRTEGYSGSDMSNLVKEASMGPLREALMYGIDINKLRKEEMRPVMLQDFENAVQHVKPSVSQNELGLYEDWNRQFGSHSL